MPKTVCGQLEFGKNYFIKKKKKIKKKYEEKTHRYRGDNWYFFID